MYTVQTAAAGRADPNTIEAHDSSSEADTLLHSPTSGDEIGAAGL